MKTKLSEKEMAREIAKQVAAAGGRVYFVGGYVRDTLLGKESKDIDIEIHGITPEELVSILDSLTGHFVKGASFGVYGINGYQMDIAMPRSEQATGKGHRDFEVFVDPWIGADRAASRRDFTINALMEDVLSGEILDFYNGRADLKNGIIRHISDESFAEDPLRVLRAAQFAARFEYMIAPETMALCSKMDVSALSKERIFAELQKALLKAKKPSIFFEVLREMNQLHTWFPELEPLIGLEQSPVYHPEGDVWIHTMQVLDNAAEIIRAKNADDFEPSDRLAFMLSALMHDLGKAETTRVIDGRIRAFNHEIEGIKIANTALHRITNEHSLIKYVENMIRLHMRPNMLAGQNSGVKATNRLFDESIDPQGLILLARCDRRHDSVSEGAASEVAGAAEIAGAELVQQNSGVDYDRFLKERLGIFCEIMSRPYVKGDDLIAAGLKPGTAFKDVLAFAHKLRLSGVSKQEALAQTLSYARQIGAFE